MALDIWLIFALQLQVWQNSLFASPNVKAWFHLPSVLHILVVCLSLFCSYFGLVYSGQFSVVQIF